MVIPEFTDAGRMPPGDWKATWDELAERFAYNFRRREILAGLKHVAEQLAAHGVSEIWIDGSFVTDKQRPDDADVVYMVPPGNDDDWPDVGPSRRGHMKKYHRVDLWRYPSYQPAKGVGAKATGDVITIKEFFESDEDGNPRGLVHLELDVKGGVDDQE